MLQFQNLAKQYQLGQQRVEALSNVLLYSERKYLGSMLEGT